MSSVGAGQRIPRRLGAVRDRCESGRIGFTANEVTFRGPWVQIPPCPPVALDPIQWTTLLQPPSKEDLVQVLRVAPWLALSVLGASSIQAWSDEGVLGTPLPNPHFGEELSRGRPAHRQRLWP